MTPFSTAFATAVSTCVFSATLWFRTVEACVRIRISTTDPSISELEGVFQIDPTYLGNGRPVFAELNGERLLYHYVNQQHSDDDYGGRWIIGDDVTTDRGWAYLPTWSVNPSTEYVNALLGLDGYEEELEWVVSSETGEWSNNGNMRAVCDDFELLEKHHKDSHFDGSKHHYQIEEETLFITTQSRLREYRLNEFHTDDLTMRGIHGIYYRMLFNVWRKLDSDMFLYRVQTEPSSSSLSLWGSSKTSTFDWYLFEDETSDVDDFHYDTLDAPPFNLTDEILANQHYLHYHSGSESRISESLARSKSEGISTWTLKVPQSYLDGTHPDSNSELQKKLKKRDGQEIKLTILTIDTFRSDLISDDDSSLNKDDDMTALKHGYYTSKISRRPLTIYDSLREYYRRRKLNHPSIGPLLKKPFWSEGLTIMNNGLPFPTISFGTGMIVGYANNVRAMSKAVNEAGYVSIDSASAYDSEEPIGDLLRGSKYNFDLDEFETKVMRKEFENKRDESNRLERTVYLDLEELKFQFDRDELFLTTKVWPTDHGFEEAMQSVDESLRLMGLNYLDHLSIHWPYCVPEWSFFNNCEGSTNKHWSQTWQSMTKLYSEGYLLSIGVSNFNRRHFDDLVNFGYGAPQVIQNHLEIYNQFEEFAYIDHAERDSQSIFQVYAPLRGLVQYEDRKDSEPFFSDWVSRLTEMYNARVQSEELSTRLPKGPLQMWLRYLQSKHLAYVSRSEKLEHMQQNIDVFHFDLTSQEMHTLFIEDLDKTEL